MFIWKRAGSVGVIVFFALSNFGCSLPPNAPLAQKTSRWHAFEVPDGSLRVAEVVHVATRDEFVKSGWSYDVLTKAGIRDEQVRDGSGVVTRVECCGGPNETGTALFAYVPDNLQAHVGDVVEIWSGKMLTEGDPLGPWPNTVTRVVGTVTNGDCRWTPNDPNLWRRVLYCDWMPSEGWSQQTGMTSFWIKPSGAASPPMH